MDFSAVVASNGPTPPKFAKAVSFTPLVDDAPPGTPLASVGQRHKKKTEVEEPIGKWSVVAGRQMGGDRVGRAWKWLCNDVEQVCPVTVSTVQYAYRTSRMHSVRPICILSIHYAFWTSNMHSERPKCILYGQNAY